METDRYVPMVKVLNGILSLDDGNEAIFICNDPVLVECNRFPDYVTKRKPDIVLVELECGKKWLGVEEPGTFERCREAAGEAKTTGKRKRKAKRKAKEREQEQGNEKAEVRRKERRGWNPIAQFWEFEMRNKLNKLSKTFRLPYEMNDLIPSASGAPEGESLSCIIYKVFLRGE